MNDNIDAKGCSQTVSETEGDDEVADATQEPCLAPSETVARKRAPSADRVHLTWEDIEAHRDALSDLQWQRITAYFHQGKRLSEIHAGDDGARRTEKTSTEHCLGRASIRLLRSMLGMSITRPSQWAHLRNEILPQAPREPEGAMALALLNVFPDRGRRMMPGPEASRGKELTGADETLTTTKSAKRVSSRDRRPKIPEPGDGDSDAVTAAAAAVISVGMRVECEVRGIWEAGRVLKIEGAAATVSLDVGGEAHEPLVALRIIPMR